MIDYQKLKGWKFAPRRHAYTAKDTILYALGIGLGTAPGDLRYVYEAGLRALPTMASVLGSPGFWLDDPETGVAWEQVVHGEQQMDMYRPIAAAGEIVAHTWVEEIVDKGPGKGALLYLRRDLFDAAGERLCSLSQTTFCRGDGGFGGPDGPIKRFERTPEREPDEAVDLVTCPRAALIFRLSGDRNPLHVDPGVAEEAGFPRPILHGLCTFGIAGYGLINALCAGRPEGLRGIGGRFSAPVYPGETVRTEIWKLQDGRAAFRCRVPARDVVVFSHGIATHGGAIRENRQEVIR